MNGERDWSKFAFAREDGAPLKILARGDCTSRRTTQLNPDLFAHGLTFIQNQKSPFVMFLEAEKGLTCTAEDLHALSDVSRMPGSLPNHYIGQADRSILAESDADLILVDTWADMNFDLWRSNEHGWLCWIHPKYLRDPETFYKTFTKVGKRSFEQSVEDCRAMIEILRKKNPSAPVLFLNQQTDFYPKMETRRVYYDFGAVMQKLVENSFYGGVIEKNHLELADVGSCGPGLTLHFQGSTYRRMVDRALEQGLASRFTAAGVKPEGIYARDNPEKVDYPKAEISFGYGPDHPAVTCNTLEVAHKNFAQYINIPGVSTSLRWTPVVIEIPRDRDYAAWERPVKKRYDRVRMKKRSERLGHVVHPFHWRLHIPDIHEIHHSTAERSGGDMRGDYLKSIEEMGGFPDRHFSVVAPKCNQHWGQSFGVFLPSDGHKQGDIQVDEKLLGYINLRRSGDLLLYSRIMGHADHLKDGVMYHLHFEIVRWVFESNSPIVQGVKFIMYGGIGNGGPNLWQWKRTAGFKPYYLVADGQEPQSAGQRSGTEAACQI